MACKHVQEGAIGTVTCQLDFLMSFPGFQCPHYAVLSHKLCWPSKYCFMAGSHIHTQPPPFHVGGMSVLGGTGFSEVAPSLHLLPLALWSPRSCLAHGHCSVPRGCGVLSASEICLAFLPPLTPPPQLSFAPHPVWSLLN